MEKHYSIQDKAEEYIHPGYAYIENFISFDSKRNLLRALAIAEIVWLAY